MRLITLTSNQRSFKSVNFNRTGLTLVVGRHRASKKTDLKKTYNGVGKSLIVALVNYCLGADRNKQFDTHLPDWAFTLTFEHGGKLHQVTRATGEARLLFDDAEISLTKYLEYLEELGAFSMPAARVNFLTFRSLLSFFLRPKNSSYVRYDHPQPKWKDYQSVLCQSFLLGLDYCRAVEKYDQKKRLDEQVGLANRYKNDSDLRAFYLGEKNAEVELIEIGAEIERLENDLAAFRVAENYAHRQQRADELHNQLADLANEIVIHKNLRADLELALKVKPDVSPAQVIEVYREASVTLPALVVKRLEDVQTFHRRLQENRSLRLSKEIAATERTVAALTQEAEGLRKELDAELQFLNAHRALDEYTANNAYLSDLRGREQRIKDYLQLLSQYTEEAQKIRAEMAQATVDTNQYIRSIRPHLDLLMEGFREYSRELYGSVPAGLTVKNNDGENQCRYDIAAHIQNDAADGINQGKIFCYDLLLLTLRQRHMMEFLFHDNRLYADMDKHQRYSLFRLADRVSREMDIQYIATVNEDVIDSVHDVAGTDFQRLFVNPVVLELTDAPDGSGKLLGIQIDMNYDD
jgi:uncharacterized protein YydD (DUF2326 family)